MAQIFISYSRKDGEFVHRLDEELKRRGREAWVDWEGIRALENWEETIYAAIEGADTFIFVLTPDSVASEICGREIKHAAAHNKRMVPLVARDVKADTVHESLAKLNWIFCRDGDDFQKATDTLVSALDTDLEWVHAHTDLLTQAIKWEGKSKSRSFVLRGEALKAAEQWLAQAGAEKERQPTALQTEYILASRKAATRRQRFTLTAVSIGLVVAVVLAVVAFFAQRRATAQERMAIKNGQEAERQKTEALNTLARSDFNQGVRLINERQTPQALAYLGRAVQKTHHPAAGTRIASLLTSRQWARPAATQHQSNAVRAFLSADGKSALALRADGGVELRVDSGQKTSTIAVRGSLTNGVFTTDNQKFVTVSMETPSDVSASGIRHPRYFVQLWDGIKGNPISLPVEYKNEIRQVLFGSGSGTFAICDRGSAHIYDLETGAELHTVPGATDIQYDAAGNLLAIMGESPAEVWNARTGKLAEINYGHQTGIARFNSDGKRLAICSNDEDVGAIQVFDVISDKALFSIAPYDPAGVVEFNADGNWLLTVTRLAARIWESDTGKAVSQELKHPSGKELRTGAFSPDGQRVATVATDGSVCVWDAATSRLAVEPLECKNAATVAFSKDGRNLIIDSEDGLERTTWDLTLGRAEPVEFFNETLAEKTIRDEFLTPSQGGRRLQVVDMLRKSNLEKDRPLDASFSEDGRRILAEFDRTVRVWNVADGQELPPLKLQAKLIGAELSPDGEKVLTASDFAALWEVNSGRALNQLFTPRATLRSAHFSHDGQRVVISTSNGVAQIFDASTGQESSPAIRHSPDLSGAVFAPKDAALVAFCASTRDEDVFARGWMQIHDPSGSHTIGEIISCEKMGAYLEGSDSPEFTPDGRLLVRDGTELRTIDLATGRRAGPVFTHRGPIRNIAFSPAEPLMATSGEEVRIWNMTDGTLAVDPLPPFPDMSFGQLKFSPDGRRLLIHASVGFHEPTGAYLIIIDVGTGLPLTDWRHEEYNKGGDPRFARDGRRIITASDCRDLAPPGPAPDWLADLANVVGGYRLDENGVLKPLPDRAAEWVRMTQKVNALPADDPWAPIGRWFVESQHARTVSPYWPVKASEYVQRLIKENTRHSLLSAISIAPDEALAYSHLGSLLLAEKEHDDPSKDRSYADHATLLATLLSPGDGEVSRTRAQVLTILQRSAEVSAAEVKATALIHAEKADNVMPRSEITTDNESPVTNQPEARINQTPPITKGMLAITKQSQQGNEPSKQIASSQTINERSSLPPRRGPWLFPDSSSRYLSATDLSSLSSDDLWRARNEIFARKGYKFSSPRGIAFAHTLGNYYHGVDDNQDRVFNNMNQYEKANVKLIQSKMH